MTSHDRLIARFAFSVFSRIQARAAGLESDLSAAESAGLVRFVRCAGADSGTYIADNELFRCLA
jgi:hypothetical protein